MIRVQDYTDYRIFLKDYFDEIKREKTCFSYRRIAQILKIDPGTLVKILHGKRHISERMIPVFANFLGLLQQDLEFFTCLVHYNKTKDYDKKLHFENSSVLKLILHKNSNDRFCQNQ